MVGGHAWGVPAPVTLTSDSATPDMPVTLMENTVNLYGVTPAPYPHGSQAVRKLRGWL